jgi:hypothetical protein
MRFYDDLKSSVVLAKVFDRADQVQGNFGVAPFRIDAKENDPRRLRTVLHEPSRAQYAVAYPADPNTIDFGILAVAVTRFDDERFI